MPVPDDTYYHNAEKIKEALKEIKELEKWYDSAIYLHDNPQGRALMAHVEQIKKILEADDKDGR